MYTEYKISENTWNRKDKREYKRTEKQTTESKRNKKQENLFPLGL